MSTGKLLVRKGALIRSARRRVRFQSWASAKTIAQLTLHERAHDIHRKRFLSASLSAWPLSSPYSILAGLGECCCLVSRSESDVPVGPANHYRGNPNTQQSRHKSAD